jgi:MFS family permease
MSTAAPASGSWADVLGEGRLPRFALICLGVWLNAADSLITATIMPSVGRSLGGYVYFGWATAGYLLGSVLAGASSGFLALRFGLRSATAAAALLYAIGCALSAVAPEIFTFLVGRILQGIGGGWVVGLCSAAIGMLFANRLLPRLYSAISSVWGIAVLVGPVLGGLFADAGAWRAVFWLFALQGAAVAVAASRMLPTAQAAGVTQGVAWRQLGLVAVGVLLIGLADLAGDFMRTAALTGIGVAAFLLALRLDGRSTVRLLPQGSGDMRTAHGAGYATMFLLNAAAMGLPVYGPAVLQTLRGLSALAAAMWWAPRPCSGPPHPCRWPDLSAPGRAGSSGSAFSRSSPGWPCAPGCSTTVRWRWWCSRPVSSAPGSACHGPSSANASWPTWTATSARSAAPASRPCG